MSDYVPPPDKVDGNTVTGAEYNNLKNGIASYLNNENIGGDQISNNPVEKIPESKLALTAATGAHQSRHAPGGADELNDLDIGNTGTLVSAHVGRHLPGGADPIPNASLNGSVIIPGTLPQSVTAWRKQQESFIQNASGMAADPKNVGTAQLINSTANPCGRGVVRSGFIYVAAKGFVPNGVLKIDPVAGTESVISLAANDVVRGLVLIGTNIYVLCGSGVANLFIKKIDANDVVTTVIDLNSGAAPNNMSTALWLRPNGAGTRLFCIGSAATNYVIGVNIDGTSLTKTNTTSAAAFYGLQYAKRGADEKLFYIEGTNLVRRNIDGSADLTLAVGGGAARRLMYDGEHIVVALTGGVVNHLVVDPWGGAMVALLSIPNPTTMVSAIQNDDLATDVNGDQDLFDGRVIYFTGRGSGWSIITCLYPAEGYRAMNRPASHGTTYTPGAIAADSTYIYAFYANAGTDCRWRKFLRD